MRFAHITAALAAGLLLSTAGLATAQPADGPAESAPDVKALVDQGKEAFRAKDYDKAVVAFEQVIAADPSVVAAHIGLGRSLERLKRYEDAVTAYRGMMKAHPDRPDPMYRLGIVYRKLEKYEASVRAYKRYIEKKPDDPDPYYGLGESLRMMNDTVGAIKAYEKYAEIETRAEEQKYVKQAQAYIVELEQKRAADAGGDTNEGTDTANVDLGEKDVTTPDAEPPALERPDIPEGTEVAAAEVDSVMAQADAAFEAGDHARAAGLYRDVLRTQPNSLQAAYKAGVALAVAGELGGALDAFELARDIDPGFEPAAENYERVKRRLAVDAVLDPEALAGTADERRALGEQWLADGRYLMAVRAADALASVAPEDPTAKRMMAEALLGLEAHRDALDALEAELALQPGDVDVYALLGRAHEELGEREQAIYFYRLYLNAADPDGSDATVAIAARVEALNTAE